MYVCKLVSGAHSVYVLLFVSIYVVLHRPRVHSSCTICWGITLLHSGQLGAHAQNISCLKVTGKGCHHHRDTDLTMVLALIECSVCQSELRDGYIQCAIVGSV